MNRQSEFTGEKLNDRIDSLMSNLKGVAEHLSTAAAGLKERAAEAKSHAMARASSMAKRAGQAIQDHPILTLGIGLGAGYLVMRLIRRR